jgi:hypothetical protein
MDWLTSRNVFGEGLERMIRKALQPGKIQYWALIVSVAAHSATLAVFTGVKMSGTISKEATAEPPVMNVSMIERIVEQPQPKPKPRVEPITPPETLPPVEQAPLITEPEPPQPEIARAAAEPIKPEIEPSVVEQEIANEVEFFGQKSIVQRICYVVDCSGSMYGSMYLVKDQLKQSILNLNSQQAFCVLFFMKGQQIRTTGNGTLERATAQVKSRALELIESIRPSGLTDAEHALGKAMQLKDAHGNGAEVIYFLSDGFDLDPDSSAKFLDTVGRLRNSLDPGATLHTIGFWPQPSDRDTLQTLAHNTGGEFIEVK